MKPPTPRSVVLVILAFVIPWVVISLCNFVMAERGGIYQATRSWYVAGIGGRYGALESEATKQIEHSIQHTAWETEFYCGPLRLSLPFSAPVSVRVLAFWVAAPVGVGLLLRFGKHARRQAQAG